VADISSLQQLGKRLDTLKSLVSEDLKSHGWILDKLHPLFVECIQTQVTSKQEALMIQELNKVIEPLISYRFNKQFEDKVPNMRHTGLIKEAFRLQTLAGLNPINECGDCQRSGYGGQPEPETRDFTHGEDHEGSMAMSELKSLQSNSSRLINLIGDNAELPGWVSSYITLAADYMSSVADYLSSEADEQTHGY